jgi:hypothetical protein
VTIFDWKILSCVFFGYTKEKIDEIEACVCVCEWSCGYNPNNYRSKKKNIDLIVRSVDKILIRY